MDSNSDYSADPRVLSRGQVVAGSSLTGVTVVCPWARHINPSLVLVQPRKTPPDITEKVFSDWDVKNQINQKLG